MASDPQTPHDADELLATHERVAERVGAQRVPREAAYFSLWLGLVTTVFVTVFVITFDATDEYSPTFTMMFPLLAASLLTNGVLGLLIATTATAYATVISSFVAMIVLLSFLVTLRARFGLPTAGFEWSRVHWIAFSVAVALCFGAVLLRAFSPWLTLPVAGVLGVVAAAAMAAPAFLPRGTR